MEKKTKEELWANWVATQNVDRFHELLKHETDEGKYKILEALLSAELQKFKRAPSP